MLRYARRLAALIGVVALAIIAAAATRVINDARTIAPNEPPPSPVFPLREALRSPRALGESARPIYRHSVIPGGAYSPDEVAHAMRRDGVVAAHYSGVVPDRLRAEALDEDRAAYMSYRVGDQIYWTKQKVRLPAGETVLSDGTHHIRARCGNCIAFAPMEPTSDEEPAEMEFEALIESDAIDSAVPLRSELLPPLDKIPLPWLVGIPVDPGASGNITTAIPVFGFPLDPVSEPTLSDPSLGRDGTLVLPPALDELISQPLPPPRTGGVLPGDGGPDDPIVPVIPVDPIDPTNPSDPVDPPGTPWDPESPDDLVTVPAPEPGTLLLVGGGIFAAIARRRRRR